MGCLDKQGALVPKIKLNDKEFEVQEMTQSVQGLIAHLQLIDSEVAKMQANIAIFQTAKNAYMKTLEDEIQKAGTEKQA